MSTIFSNLTRSSFSLSFGVTGRKLYEGKKKTIQFYNFLTVLLKKSYCIIFTQCFLQECVLKQPAHFLRFSQDWFYEWYIHLLIHINSSTLQCIESKWKMKVSSPNCTEVHQLLPLNSLRPFINGTEEGHQGLSVYYISIECNEFLFIIVQCNEYK